jgi:hypothetical protein
MGTPIDDGGQVQDNSPDAGDVPGPNPAWNDVLNVLPEQFHQVVTPHFQKWDQAAQSKIEAANSSLKDFEGFKPFVEHGINPQEVEQGLRLMWEINNNPENVYKALAEAYKFGEQVAPVAKPNVDGDNDDDEDTPYGIDPEISSKLEQHDGLLQAVAQIVLNDAQAKESAAADSALEKELSTLKEKHGDYDEEYVLTKMLNGASGEDAVKSYQDLVQRLSPKPFAPNVLGSNGGGTGLPSQAIDPTQLSGKETRDLVAQMLAAEFGKK